MSHIAAKDAMSNSLGAQTLGLGGTAVVEIGRRIRTPLRGTAVGEIGGQLMPLMANSEKPQTFLLRTTTTMIKAISHKQGNRTTTMMPSNKLRTMPKLQPLSSKNLPEMNRKEVIVVTILVRIHHGNNALLKLWL